MNEQLPIPPTDHGKSLLQWLYPTRRFLKVCAWILLIQSVLFFLSVQIWIHYWFKPFLIRRVSAQEYQKYREFWNSTLDFPLEYIYGIPISDNVEKAYGKMDRIRVSLFRDINSPDSKDPVFELSQQWNIRGFGNIDYDDLQTRITSIEPYFDAVSNLAEQIQTAVLSLTPGDLLPIYEEHAWQRDPAWQVFLLRACFLSRQKKYDESFNDYMTCFPFLLHGPYQNIHNYLDYYQIEYASREAAIIAPFVLSKNVLRMGLQRLNQFEPFLFLDILDRYNTLRLMDKLKSLERRELEKFDTNPGKPAVYYIHQMARKTIPQMRFTQCLPLIWQFALAGRKPMNEEIAGLFRPFALSNAINEYFYMQVFSLEDPVPVQKHRIYAAVQFDILRLRIAARLYEFETGKKVLSTKDLVPDYLPEEIRERESGEAYRWSANGDLAVF